MLLIDLHRHLDGNIRIQTIFDLAKKQNSPLSRHTIKSLESLIYIDEQTSDLLAFLKRLDYGVSVLETGDDCYRVAYENVEDASNEGLDYVELRFSPYYMAKPHNISLDKVVQAVCRGVADACVDFSVNANLIGILSRTYGVDLCHAELDSILKEKKHFVAVDLAGDEKNFPPDMFVSHFDKVKQAELNITIHAGEAGGPENVWAAIEKLHANRIGHGVNAVYDESLMEYMAEKKIGVESCLTSNYQTATWTNLSNHPVLNFLQYGIEVCLCTDDPGVSNITLADEFNLSKRVLALSDEQITTLVNNAHSQAFNLS